MRLAWKQRGWRRVRIAFAAGIPAAAVLLLISGCETNRYAELGYRFAAVPAVKPRAFVENPELETEFKLLTYAELYDLSGDPTTTVHIVLKKMKTFGVCGNTLFPLVFTLGLIPVSTCEFFPPEFRFSVRDATGEQHYSYKLTHTYLRISVWERGLGLFANEPELLGKVLRTEAIRNSQQDDGKRAVSPR